MNDTLTYTYISVEIERDKRDFFRWYAKKHHMSMRGFLGKVVSDLYEQYFEQYAQAMEERQRQNDLNDLMWGYKDPTGSFLAENFAPDT